MTNMIKIIGEFYQLQYKKTIWIKNRFHECYKKFTFILNTL